MLNLCCCGSECGSFLRTRIQPRSISRIYVNHPEPPTQADVSLFANDSDQNTLDTLPDRVEEESAHMLNSGVLKAALNSLKGNGRGEFITVADNRWYASLIYETVVNVINERNEKITQLFNNGSKNAGNEKMVNFVQKKLTD